MNKLEGRIVNVESSPEMSIVEVDVERDIFSAIVLETPGSGSYLNLGSTITLLFKETEVSIGKNLSGLISMRNRFGGRIKKIEKSAILTTVMLDYKGLEIVSIISTQSANRLELKEMDDVQWLVKTNEVSLWHTI